MANQNSPFYGQPQFPVPQTETRQNLPQFGASSLNSTQVSNSFPQSGGPQQNFPGVSGPQFANPTNVQQFGGPPSYNNPQTGQYSPIRMPAPVTFANNNGFTNYANIFNNNNNAQAFQQQQNFLPNGVVLGIGRHSQFAVDYLARNCNTQNNLVQFSNSGPQRQYGQSAGFGLHDFRQPGENEIQPFYENPKPDMNLHSCSFDDFSYFGRSEPRLTRRNSSGFDKKAFANHLKNALYKITPISQRFRDIKATLEQEDAQRMDTSRDEFRDKLSSRTCFDSFKHLQTPPTSNPYKPCTPPRRYYSVLPNSDGFYFRRRDLERMPADLLHENDIIEVSDLPDQQFQPSQFVNDSSRWENGIVMRNGTSRDSVLFEEPKYVNSITLKDAVPWKKLYETNELKTVLAKDILDSGRNRRSLLEHSKLFRRMSSQPQNLYGNGRESYMSNSTWCIPQFNSTGPPKRNDFPDFSELIQSNGIVPVNHSHVFKTRNEPLVGNLPKRLSPSDFPIPQKLSGQYFEPQFQRSYNIGGISVTEFVTRNSASGSNCNTLFQRDWITVTIPPVISEVFEEIKPTAYKKITPRSRQRRARSRMTAGQNVRLRCGITLTNANYYCRPSIEELHSVTDSEGNCFVENFEVGHVEFGNIVFLGNVNVAGLNLDTTVQFFHREVIVYPTPDVAPAIGDGLNRPAIVTLEGVWPNEASRSKPDLETDSEIQWGMSVQEKFLRDCCKKFNGDFISYDPGVGRWVFWVPHF